MQINLNPTSERGASRDAVNRPRETLGDSHLISSDPRSRFGLVCDLLCCRGNKNADYRGGVTCLYDTQLLGTCLHASESGGRSRPGAVRGMPDVPIAPPATGPPEGWAAVGFVSPASFNRGLCARLLRVLGS